MRYEDKLDDFIIGSLVRTIAKGQVQQLWCRACPPRMWLRTDEVHGCGRRSDRLVGILPDLDSLTEPSSLNQLLRGQFSVTPRTRLGRGEDAGEQTVSLKP